MAKQAKKAKDRKPSKIEMIVRENPARAIMVVLAVILVLRIGVLMNEAPTASPAPQPEVVTVPTPIQFEGPFRKFVEPKPEFENSGYEMLANANIFDPKQVLNPTEQQRAAEELYKKAQIAFESYRKTKKKEDLDKASGFVNEALEKLPSHFQARRLRDEQISPALGIMTSAAKAAAVAGNAQTTGTAEATPAGGAPPAEATPAAPTP